MGNGCGFKLNDVLLNGVLSKSNIRNVFLKLQEVLVSYTGFVGLLPKTSKMHMESTNNEKMPG